MNRITPLRWEQYSVRSTVRSIPPTLDLALAHFLTLALARGGLVPYVLGCTQRVHPAPSGQGCLSELRFMVLDSGTMHLKHLRA